MGKEEEREGERKEQKRKGGEGRKECKEIMKGREWGEGNKKNGIGRNRKKGKEEETVKKE